jgi:MoaA/NifB/PqqE/SkfB family radical SAM enzyme
VIVLWRATTACNLACGFCAYDRRLPFARSHVDPMEAERFGAVLGAWSRARGEPVLVSWLGGEPLAWTPLFDLSRRLRRGHGLRVSATTNGTTLARADVRDAVLADFAELTVSVDGLAPFHEGVRGWRGGWARLRDGVRRLAAERDATGSPLVLRANTVLMRDNIGSFAALCDELAGWGVDEITFNQLGGRDRPEFFPAHALRPADVSGLRDCLPDLRARLRRRGVRLCFGEAYLRRFEASARGEPLPVAQCRPGEALLFVDEAGRVAPCAFTVGEYGVPIAELDAPAALDGLPSRFAARRAEARAGACGDCPSTQVFAKFAHARDAITADPGVPACP